MNPENIILNPQPPRYELGNLPEVEKKGRIQEKELSPEVEKTRENLRNLILDQMPYVDEKKIRNMTSRELVDLYLNYFNNEPQFGHFLRIIKSVGSPQFISLLEQIRGEVKEENIISELKPAFLLYLYNKLPFSMRENQFIAGKDKNDRIPIQDILEELNFDEPEKISETDLERQVDQIITKLEKLNVSRKKDFGLPLIAFHTSSKKNLRDISVSHGYEQVNYNAPSAGTEKLSSGAKFFSYKLDKLYLGDYLYFVFSNQLQAATKVYDEATTAAADNAPLEIIPPDIMQPIHLIPEILADLSAAYGAK